MPSGFSRAEPAIGAGRCWASWERACCPPVIPRQDRSHMQPLEAQLTLQKMLPPKHPENRKYCRGQPQPTCLALAATKPTGMVQVRPRGVPPGLAQLWRSRMASSMGSAGCQIRQGVGGWWGRPTGAPNREAGKTNQPNKNNRAMTLCLGQASKDKMGVPGRLEGEQT